MTITSNSESKSPDFFQFMNSLREKQVEGLDAGIISELFGSSPASLFQGAKAALSDGVRRDQFNDDVCWLLEHLEYLDAPQRPMLRIAAAVTQLVARDGDRSDDGLACLKDAVQGLDSEWPNKHSVGTPKSELFKTSIFERHPELKTQFEQAETSLALWYAWDVLMFLHRDDTVDKDVPFQTAHAPVLLVDETEQRGVVALLTLELLQDGGRGITPIPESLGLTALQGDFHDAMQRAWRLSGIEGWRGRWKLTQFPTSPDKLDVPLLTGHSLEAAVCATLWSAFGSIPGTQQTTPDAPIEERGQPPKPVDLRAAITARLGELPVSGKRDEIPLLPIEGLVSKFKAAREAELEVVIVADDQEPKAGDAWISSQPSRLGPPKRCGTIGKAWDQIHADIRFLRVYQRQIVTTWKERWRDEIDVPDETSTAAARSET